MNLSKTTTQALTISAAERAWLIQPILDQLKIMEANIMADTAKDVDTETAKLATLVSTVAQDVLAAIAALEKATAPADLTPEVNALIALEKPLQDLDAAATTITNPPPPAPAA